MGVGKGSLVVGQSGGCTMAINSSLVGVIHEALEQPGIDRVLGMVHGIQGLIEERLIDLGRQNRDRLEGLRSTPSAALGSGRYRLTDNDLERVLAVLRAHQVHIFIYIGGNDSADTSNRIERAARAVGWPLRVVAVPKTIDNDLPLTDHTPGYGSAARFIATATLEAGRDSEGIGIVDRVKFVEVLGRDAGWLTAAAALGRRDEADAPHLLFPPERPVEIDRALDDVQRVFDRLGFVVGVVAETVRDPQGRPLGQKGVGELTDAFGHAHILGAAETLADAVWRRLKLRARWDKPGTIGRMTMALASPVDLEEAYQAGRAAVRAALAGHTGQMVTLLRESDAPYRCTTGLAPLAAVANQVKRLPTEYLTPDGHAITDAFRRYAEPLLGGPLPRYPRLAYFPVERRLPPETRLDHASAHFDAP